MLGNTYDDQNCSAARALEIAGERWSLLILRDALFRGMRRFSEFQKSLRVASNVLAVRLETFVEEGILKLQPGSSRADQQEYQITDKGRDFAPVIMALMAWGDRWAAPHGPPVLLRHDGCGGKPNISVYCPSCGGDGQHLAMSATATEARSARLKQKARAQHEQSLRKNAERVTRRRQNR